MDRMGSPTDRYSGASSGAAVIGGRRCSGWAGTPTTVVRAATSWIATAPAPITAWVPTVTLGRTVALAPTKAPMPSLAWPVMTACGESVTKSASSASWPMEQWEFTCTCAPSTAPAFTALWGQMMQPSPTLALDRTTAVGWITVAHRCRSWLARATNPSLARGSATQQTRYASGYALATSRPPSTGTPSIRAPHSLSLSSRNPTRSQAGTVWFPCCTIPATSRPNPPAPINSSLFNAPRLPGPRGLAPGPSDKQPNTDIRSRRNDLSSNPLDPFGRSSPRRS